MLSMYVTNDHKNWDEILPYVTLAYNTATQETTGFTPFRLLYGREVTTMLDAMLLPDICKTGLTDVEAFTVQAEKACQLARQCICHQQSYDARRYNLRHRQVDYSPSDYIWVCTPIEHVVAPKGLYAATLAPT